MGKLTIQEVARVLVEKNGLTHKEANQFASEMFAVILQRLQDGEQVKVKGLGTFKIINVEARESVSVRTGERVVIDSHSKVSFTPDAVMKELVNKPFSQFETVVLNDGVEFADMPDDKDERDDEEETVQEKQTTQETPVVEEPVVEEPVAEEPVAEEPIAEEPVAEEPVAEEPVVEAPVAEAPVVEAPVAEEPVVEAPVVEEPDAEESNSMRWLLGILCVLLLMMASAYGGYYYGRSAQTAAISDTIHDTIFVADQQDSVVAEKPAAPIATEAAQVAPEAAKQAPEVAKQEKPAAEKKPAEEPLDKWSAKDDRVRLGAYRIVGTQCEVTIQPGQTFYSICKAYLGPDMECYVEVYNDLPRRPQLKAGQTVKIPKLQVKKRKKKY